MNTKIVQALPSSRRRRRRHRLAVRLARSGLVCFSHCSHMLCTGTISHAASSHSRSLSPPRTISPYAHLMFPPRLPSSFLLSWLSCITHSMAHRGSPGGCPRSPPAFTSARLILRLSSSSLGWAFPFYLSLLNPLSAYLSSHPVLTSLLPLTTLNDEL